MADIDYIVNPLVAGATVIAHVVFLVLLIFFLLRREWLRPISFYALPILFAFALGGTALSLFYSDVLGYLPCDLCWWQRIFLYPQAIIFAIALWRGEAREALRYSMILSAFGFLVALYQYLLQWGIAPSINCASGGGPDCAVRVILGFGYITIPLIALSGFAFMLLVAYLRYRDR